MPSLQRHLPALLILAFLTVAAADTPVACRENEHQLVLTRAGKHVLSYQKTIQLPKGMDERYGRSGFIHPITTPAGKVITDDYPQPHHGHQHGLFFAWRDTTFEGKNLNFWEHGRDTVRHDKVVELINEPAVAGFTVALAHVSGERVVLRETWTVLIHAETGFVDFTSTQQCATNSPLTLNRFHYGGMAIRGSRHWFSDGKTTAGKVPGPLSEPCTLLTSEGLTQKDGNHSRPKWVCMTGSIDKTPVSITLIPHPTNLRSPQHVRLHPKMPYFCFIPTVEEPFTIEPGTPYTSRYRLVIEDGKPDPEYLHTVQRAFAVQP